MGKTRQPDSKYATWGTTAHSAIESYLKGQLDEVGGSLSRDLFAKRWGPELVRVDMPMNERDALWSYINRLHREGIRSRLVHLEHRWHLKVHPAIPALSGSCDIVAYGDEPDTLVIVDHKTIRRKEDADDWRMKTQQLLYPLWARNAYPGMKIRFRIGYINLGSDVEWETDPAMDQAMLQRFVWAWQEMEVYERTQRWPETINEDCRYCPVRNDCRAQQEAVSGTLASLEGPKTETDLEALVRLQRVEKMAGDMAGEIKEKIMAEAVAAGGQLDLGSYRATVTQGKRREANFTRVRRYLNAATDACLERIDEDKLFSVKVSELDKVLEELDCMEDAASLMTSKPTAPSLKVSSLKPS